MKAKIFFTVLVIAAAFSFSKTVRAQEDMDFEEFMGMMSETFTDQQLDEMSYQLPWDIRVYGYAYGDFSGDGRDDIVLSVREKNVTPKNTLDIYVLENVDNITYKLVRKSNIKWIELPVEIAFLAKNGLCYMTNRDQSNWYFTGYKIENDNVVQVDREVYPIEVEKAGE